MPPPPPPVRPSRPALRARLDAREGRISAARARSPFSADEVTVVIVTKSVANDELALVSQLARRHIGENRVVDAAIKRESAPRGLVWHGIGHLQTNKAKKAISTFDVFHALDSVRLAEVLEPLLAATGRRWPVYAQVNAANDPRKDGVEAEDALGFLRHLERFPHLDVVGLMTIAKEEDRGEAARPAFRTLREIRDDARRAGLASDGFGLSMGMSDDFDVAVEEGATIVRLGRALWAEAIPGAATPGIGLDAGRPSRTVTPEAR